MFDWLKGSPILNPLIRIGYTFGSDLANGGSVTNNSYSNWLLNGEWSEEKYAEYLLYTVIPGMSQYTDYLTSYNDDVSYMDRYDIDWSDVKRPWNFKSNSSARSSVRSMLNYVSSNVTRLYD